MLEEILRTGKTGRKWYPKAQKYYDYLLPAGSELLAELDEEERYIDELKK